MQRKGNRANVNGGWNSNRRVREDDEEPKNHEEKHQKGTKNRIEVKSSN